MTRLAPKPLFVLLMLAVAACGESDRLPDESSSSIEADRKIPISTGSVTARAAYVEARALMESLRYTESVEFVDRALELDPDFALANLMRAMTAQSADDFFAYIERAEAALEEVSLGEQLLVKAFRAATQGDSEAQLALLRKLVALYPGDERAHMQLGSFFLEQQAFREAIEHFEAAVAIDARFAPAYNMLGYAHRGNEDYDAARLAFSRYIELVPDEPNPYDSYAEMLMEAGEYGDSIEMYEKALQIDADFISSRAGIAINEALRGNPGRGVKVAEETLLRARNFKEREYAMQHLAGAYLHAGDYDAALGVVDRMSAMGGENGIVLLVAGAEEFRGDILLAGGDSDAAMLAYKRALELRRDSGLSLVAQQRSKRQFLFKATLTALQTGWSPTADDYLEQYEASAMMAGSSLEKQRIHELKGYAALLQDDFATAVLELSKARQTSPVVQYFLALAYENVDDLESAAAHARRAAYSNTRSRSLPFFRQQALALIKRVEGNDQG